MPSKASLLIVSLIAGAAAISQAAAATHERDAPLKASAQTAQDSIPTADAKPVKATGQKTAPVVASHQGKANPAAFKRPRKQANAKTKTARTANARAATAKSHAVSQRQALSHAKPTSRMSPRRARYVDERARALDVAAHYAPKTIARLRRNRTIERAETSRASRDAGWHRYVDTHDRAR